MKIILILLLSSIVTIFSYSQKNNFIPDVSVIGIKLRDVYSMDKKFPNYKKLLDFPLEAEVYLLNKDESETLTVSFYAGTSADEPMEFHISMTDETQLNKLKTIKLNVDRFTTESNIKLHISKDDLIKIKGQNYKLEKYGDLEIVKYRIDNIETSDFLQSFGLPEYFADYTFQKGKLLKVDFGFTNP